MSKVLARIARITIISTFYIEYVFSQLELILVPQRYIFYTPFLPCENEEEGFTVFEGMVFCSNEAHRWNPRG